MNSLRVFAVMDSPALSWVRCVHRDEASADAVEPNRDGRWRLRRPSTESSSIWRAIAPPRMRRRCERRFCSSPTSTRIGATPPLPEPWTARIGRSANGGGAGRARPCRTRHGPRDCAFCPFRDAAQVTALACTLPRDSGKSLSRWSASELARAVVQGGIVRRISCATVQRWLKADRIKPWQYHSWPRTTDPRFLERAIPILTLSERAHALARKGHILVCADEKTSIQARQACRRTTPACPWLPDTPAGLLLAQGAGQLFGGLRVDIGETLTRCFDQTRGRGQAISSTLVSGAVIVDPPLILPYPRSSGPASSPRLSIHTLGSRVVTVVTLVTRCADRPSPR